MKTGAVSNGDVAIVGAGIIGLSVAFEFSGRGAAVHVYDTDEPARAASWAAAGMLAPLTEHLIDPPLQGLCELSLALYPQFAKAVREVSGIDPHLRLDGIIHCAFSESEYERLRTHCADLHAAGHSARILTRSETLLAEPAVSKNVCGALLIEGEGHVDNRRLGRALVAACQARGVHVHTGVASLALEFNARRVLGVHTELGYMPAGVVINAAGANAGRLAGVPAECVPPVRAVKGQMLSLQVPSGLIRRATWVPGAYFVPRIDGRLLIGATVEEADDLRVTAGGIRDLLNAAMSAAPSLREFPVSETWAGLRPATPDGRPCLGRTHRTGYYVATGHYRNGILLAPVTGRLLADSVIDEQADRRAFAIERFSTEAGIA
jgi:glycine oxidase